MRESKPPEIFCSYLVMVSNNIDSYPSTFKEVVGQKVWKDSMVEEYNYIMKNDVWEVVLRHEGKSVVTSK